MLAMLAFVPGFLDGFVRSMLLLLRLGTNIESPWLWPWDVELAGASPVESAAQIALAVAYLLPFVVLPVGLWRLLVARPDELRRRALLLAATPLAVLFLHHASVRSDASHLAQSLQPTLLATVGLVAIVAERRRALAALLALLLGAPLAFAAFEHNPALNHVGRTRLVPVKLGARDELRMLAQHADYYARLQRVIGGHLQPGERIFFAPARPSFYPLFDRPSPTWWIYFFVPDADRAEQEELIAELAGVEWVLIVDQAIAGREELRFHESYPLVWTHVQAAYRRVPTPELEGTHRLYRLRE
jgi:hypothetical protein